MKSIAVAIAIAVLGVSGFCRADERTAVMPQSDEDVGAPSRPLRAVLYEVSREHTIQKRFAGSIVWHTDLVASAAEGSPKFVIRADVEIPDLQMMVKLVVARNDDRSFRASHTVEIMVTLPPDFVHSGVLNVPRIIMKQGETTPGIPLNSVAVKITPRLFQIGLSNIDADRQRNIELIKQLPWIDLPIVYSDGSWAILGIEKAPLGDRALAVLELPAAESTSEPQRENPTTVPPAAPVRAIPTVPVNHPPGDAVLKPWPVASATPAVLRQVVQPPVQMSLPVPDRPVWAWPRSVSWAQVPGFSMPSWTWQGGWQSASPPIRLASLALPVSPKPPWWLQGVWTVAAAEAVPPWPRARAPDFRLPAGQSRFSGEKTLEPPSRFLRWTDRLETVLADAREVARICLPIVGKPLPAGRVYRGCAHKVAGRCLITRVDDPGVARHEAAHCAGWPADHRRG
jgi:hypothetical protein